MGAPYERIGEIGAVERTSMLWREESAATPRCQKKNVCVTHGGGNGLVKQWAGHIGGNEV